MVVVIGARSERREFEPRSGDFSDGRGHRSSVPVLAGGRENYYIRVFTQLINSHLQDYNYRSHVFELIMCLATNEYMAII